MATFLSVHCILRGGVSGAQEAMKRRKEEVVADKQRNLERLEKDLAAPDDGDEEADSDE